MKPYQLSKTHRIIGDENCYALQALKSKGSKGYQWEGVAWFATLEQLLNSYMHGEVRRSAKPLPDAVADAVRVMSEASQALSLSLTLKL